MRIVVVFPAPVGADEAGHSAGLHGEGDVLEHPPIPELRLIASTFSAWVMAPR